jgi:hypothetical protein
MVAVEGHQGGRRKVETGRKMGKSQMREGETKLFLSVD